MLGLALAALAACGGDDSGGSDDGADPERGTEDVDSGAAAGDRDDYVDALAASYDNPYTTPEDRRCMAEATVEVLGVDALAAAGTADELRESDRLQLFGVTPDEATAGELVDALDACVDGRTVLFGDEAALGPEVRACLDTAIPDDLLRRFMIATTVSATGLSDDPELDAAITAAQSSCR